MGVRVCMRNRANIPRFSLKGQDRCNFFLDQSRDFSKSFSSKQNFNNKMYILIAFYYYNSKCILYIITYLLNLSALQINDITCI